jgi:hypothetical protein
MFAFEHHRLKKSHNSLRKGIFITGMPLAKGRSVFKSISYREITIAAGILVALIIFITLWMDQGAAGATSALDILHLPRISVPETKKIIQETLQKVLL